MPARPLAALLAVAVCLWAAGCQVEQRRGPVRMRYQDPNIQFKDPGQFQKQNQSR